MRIGIIGLGVVGSAINTGFDMLGHDMIVHDPKLKTKIKDILSILLFISFGYITLIAAIIVLVGRNKDKIIWKYPKKK